MSNEEEGSFAPEGYLHFEEGNLRLNDCRLAEFMRSPRGYATDMQISGWIPQAQFPTNLTGKCRLIAANLRTEYACFKISDADTEVCAKGYGDERGLFVKVRFLHNNNEEVK